jgi:hypothetical protein
MADPRDGYTLRPPQSSDDWIAYHAIRRDAIFAPLLPRHPYDESDPDEFQPVVFRISSCATARSSVPCASTSSIPRKRASA